MMESIAAASMSMSNMQFQTAYDMAVLKKSMAGMESQAEALIDIRQSRSAGGFRRALEKREGHGAMYKHIAPFLFIG